MPDKKSVKAEEKEVEIETTQVESPTTEAPTTEEQTTELESADQVSKPESTDEIPVGSENWTAEQRRAFQEQRQEIKRLREEVSEREKSESAFSAFRATTPPASQPVIADQFIDPATGETNWTAYNNAIAQREQQLIQQVNFNAQQTASEIVDENNARNKHPELFADRETEQEIADRWFAAKMRGENPSIVQIADRMAKRYGKAVSKAEKIGAEKAFTEMSEKEKAGLSASGQTSEPARQESSEEDYQQLRVKTRGGDKDALTARISKIPWVNK